VIEAVNGNIKTLPRRGPEFLGERLAHRHPQGRQAGRYRCDQRRSQPNLENVELVFKNGLGFDSPKVRGAVGTALSSRHQLQADAQTGYTKSGSKGPRDSPHCENRPDIFFFL
jgi:hypothetical protein